MNNSSFSIKFCNDGNLSAGDVIIDRRGNEMVIVEVIDPQTGDCYALFNGQVRLVNASKVAKVLERKDQSTVVKIR